MRRTSACELRIVPGTRGMKGAASSCFRPAAHSPPDIEPVCSAARLSDRTLQATPLLRADSASGTQQPPTVGGRWAGGQHLEPMCVSKIRRFLAGRNVSAMKLWFRLQIFLHDTEPLAADVKTCKETSGRLTYTQPHSPAGAIFLSTAARHTGGADRSAVRGSGAAGPKSPKERADPDWYHAPQRMRRRTYGPASTLWYCHGITTMTRETG